MKKRLKRPAATKDVMFTTCLGKKEISSRCVDFSYYQEIFLNFALFFQVLQIVYFPRHLKCVFLC